MARVLEVLSKHSLDHVRFDHRSNGLEWFAADFVLNGREHTIGVYDDDVTMTAESRLFECYLRREYLSEATLVDGFSARLTRYLSGGPWDDPDEQGVLELIKGKMKGLFRRDPSR